MKQHYTLTVSEAHTPNDGGWTTYDSVNVLLLSILEFNDIVHSENKGYSYAWLWDDTNEGYVFCFKLDNGVERAILFEESYAGKLLSEPEAQEVFHIALTSKALGKIDDDTPILWLPGVKLKTRPI